MVRRPAGLLLALIVLQTTSSSGQTPSRTLESNAIVGQVVDAVDGSPIPGVVVYVWAPGSWSSWEVLSDGSGRFVLRDIDPGLFTIKAESQPDGTIVSGAGALGLTAPSDEPRYIQIGRGEVLRDVRIPFWRDGVVAGVVTDDTGLPLEGAMVQVMPISSPVGRRSYQYRDGGLRQGQTDASGRYRVVVEPGDVVVSATATEWRSNSANSLVERSTRGFVRTFASNTPDGADAQQVHVRAGREQAGVDIRLVARPLFRMSGVVVDDRGPVAGARLRWPDRYTYLTADAGGRFAIDGVMPGRYVLEAFRGFLSYWGSPSVDETQQRVGRAAVTVQDRDVAGIQIALRRTPVIEGRVVFDGGVPPQVPAFPVFGYGPREQPTRGSVLRIGPATRVSPDATFRLLHDPGPAVLVPQVPDGWMVRSIMHSGRDFVDQAFDVDANISDVVITLSDRLTEVRGHVRSRPGTPQTDASIWILPDDHRLWANRGPYPFRFRTADVELDGTFAVDAVPAGTYVAVAVPDADRSRYRDVRVVDAASRLGTRFSIAEGERRTLELDVVSLPKIGGLPPAPVDLDDGVPQAEIVPDSATAKATTIMTGQITAADTGLPVAWAKVRLVHWNERGLDEALQTTRRISLSDADGRFAIAGVEPGLYGLRISSSRYVDALYPQDGSVHGPLVVTTDAPPRPPAIELQPAVGVTGVLRDQQGRPVIGAIVRLNAFDREGSKESAALTDDRGTFTIPKVAPGQYRLTVSIRRFAMQFTTATDLERPLVPLPYKPASDATVDLPLTIRPGENRVLEVRVTLAGG